MAIILTIIIAPIVLILGSWLSLIPFSVLLMITPKNEILNKYLARIVLGATVGALFGFMEYFGASNTILWIVFAVSLLLRDTTYSPWLSFKLRLSRFISFLVVKNIVWGLFMFI